MTIKIRYATMDDNQLLAELGARTYYDAFAASNTAENMAAYLAGAFSPEIQSVELADPASVFLIAEVGAETVGYARLKEGSPPEGVASRRPIEIVRIYAVKERIGKGVGAALMQACLDEAARRGCDTIFLGVWEQNDRAIAFYRRWGFLNAGTHIFQLGDDLQTDLWMQRPVNLI